MSDGDVEFKCSMCVLGILIALLLHTKGKTFFFGEVYLLVTVQLD